MEPSKISLQLTQTIESLPASVQADLLAIAKDWAQVHEATQDTGYAEAVTTLLKDRADWADAHPDTVSSAGEVLDRLSEKWGS